MGAKMIMGVQVMGDLMAYRQVYR